MTKVTLDRSHFGGVRHDVMIVDPIQNIIVDRESGEPLMIDFGRGTLCRFDADLEASASLLVTTALRYYY